MSMDSTREIRAMIMASFPCPPLPMATGHGFINSHDFLAYLIDVAARRNITTENQERQCKQQTLVKQYLQDLKLCNSESELWDVMTMFTRMYAMTYHQIAHELRFFPFDSITPPLKHQVCSWLAASEILSGKENSMGHMFHGLGPFDLYKKCQQILLDANYVTGNFGTLVDNDGSAIHMDVIETTATTSN